MAHEQELKAIRLLQERSAQIEGAHRGIASDLQEIKRQMLAVGGTVDAFQGQAFARCKAEELAALTRRGGKLARVELATIYAEAEARYREPVQVTDILSITDFAEAVQLVCQPPPGRKSVTNEPFEPDEIARVKEATASEVKSILLKLENDYPGTMEGVGAALGAASGGAVSLAALWGLGTVGLSAAGITSGLATAGAIVGGGMVAGISVLAAPVAVLRLAAIG